LACPVASCPTSIIEKMNTSENLLTTGELLVHRFHEQTRGGTIISAVARFEGCLKPEDIRKALVILQQRHMALRVKIEDNGYSARFVEIDKPMPVPLSWSHTNSLDNWSGIALEQGREPFDASQGPLFRVQVLYHEELNLSDVLIVAHHAVSDGRSILVLYRELALLCAGETLPLPVYTGFRPIPLVPRRMGVVKPILTELIQRIGLIAKLRQYPLANIQQPMGQVESLRRRVWTNVGTQKLLQRARIEGTTLHGALVAAVVLTLFKWHGIAQRSVDIRSPFDIRKLCDPPVLGDPIGCYAHVLGFLLIGADQKTFWELARAARQAVQRYLNGELWAAVSRLVGGLLRFGWMPGENYIFCNINNIGRIEEVRTKSSRMIEFSVTVSQQGMLTYLMLVAATIDGTLNLTLLSPWHSSKEVEILFDNIIQHMEEACCNHWPN
jgi:hypothetical protein